MQDGNDIEIGRLAQFFTQPSDWQELFQTDLPTASQRIDLVLSSFWATYAARDRIKERVLTLAIPRYVDYTEAKNTVIYQHNLKKQKQQPTSQPTYVALQRLLDNARENEMKICFVAFPTQPIKNATSYELDSKMIKLIEQAGMYFVDMHRFPELTEKFYADEIHLTPKGAEIYTRHFVEKMTPILKKIKN